MHRKRFGQVVIRFAHGNPRGLGVVLALVLVAGALIGFGLSRGNGAKLRPVDPYESIIAATGKYSLVALGEFHQMEEWHVFMMELLRRREFNKSIDDLVVEFGNALYQDVADRFILDLELVPFAHLSQIWRNTSGGGILWDAPVYEQFFRNVRSVNETLPREERIRVLLGDPNVDFDKVRSSSDATELDKGANRDAFYADVVEREVMDKRRRAVLIAGADHLRRKVHANTGRDHPNVATLLARSHPGDLFIVYPLPYGYDEEVRRRSEAELKDSGQRPALAHLRGTWLGSRDTGHRALGSGSAFGEQVDAVIWFGPDSSLTASRADPAIYRSGAYAAELRRRSVILSEYSGEPVDFIAAGLRLAAAGPRLQGR